MAQRALLGFSLFVLASCASGGEPDTTKPSGKRDGSVDARTQDARGDSSGFRDAGLDTSSSNDGSGTEDAEDMDSAEDTGIEPGDAEADSAPAGDAGPSDARSDANPSTDGGALTGEFAVVRVHDGTSSVSTAAAAVFIERRSIATGAVLGTTPLPTAPSGSKLAFTLSGSGVAEGSLSRSADGKRLALLGYQSVPGTANVQGVTDPRVVAVIDAAGTVDTSTTLATLYSTTSPRAAVIDGTNIWVSGGTSGIFRTTLGATTSPASIVTAPSGGRDIAIFSGQLYASTGSVTTGVYQIGTGLPMFSGGSPALVVGVPSPYGFAFFDLNSAEAGLDTLYVGDDSAGAGIRVYTRTSGAWNMTPLLTMGQPVRHIACISAAADVVCIASSASNLYRVRHIGAATQSTQSDVATIATAPSNTAFRGVALWPVP